MFYLEDHTFLLFSSPQRLGSVLQETVVLEACLKRYHFNILLDCEQLQSTFVEIDFLEHEVKSLLSLKVIIYKNLNDARNQGS